MNKSVSALNRIVVFLFAVLAAVIGIGALAIYIDWMPVADWARALNVGSWDRAVDQPWYPWVLAGVALASILLVIWFVTVNARLRRPDPVLDPATDDKGLVGYGLAPIGNAAADELAEQPGIRRASCRAEVDRQRTTLTVKADVKRGTPPAEVLATCDDIAADIDDAVSPDVGVRFILRVDE